MGTIRRRAGIALVASASLLAVPPAHAAPTIITYVSVSHTATVHFDGANDTIVISDVGGNLSHGITGFGTASTTDWDTSTAGVQTVPDNGTNGIYIPGGAGNDTIVIAPGVNITSADLEGDAGDDVLIGSPAADTLDGDDFSAPSSSDGNDVIVGNGGADTISGGLGNDSIAWYEGDGDDTVRGGGGDDRLDVQADSANPDTFTMALETSRLRLGRTVGAALSILTDTETLGVESGAGNDTITAGAGLAAFHLVLQGGDGADTITGGDGADVIYGGKGVDTIDGGAGADRLVGDVAPGTTGDNSADVVSGGDGDDTVALDSNDGNDVANGDAGNDTLELTTFGGNDSVGVAPAADRFHVTVGASQTVDAGTIETARFKLGAGTDTLTVSSGLGSLSVDGSGEAGNDTLTGSDERDTFSGGDNDDILNPGGGSDVVRGDAGNDQVNVRDGAADSVLCGDGTDSVTADDASLDTLDACESADVAAPPAAAPPAETPPTTTTTTTTSTTPQVITVEAPRPVAPSLARTTLTAHSGRVLVTLNCPASAPMPCTGRLRLFTRRRVRVGRSKAIAELADVSYSLAQGTSQPVKLKLPANSASLASRGKLDARAELLATDAKGATAARATRNVTLRFAARRRA